MDDPNAVSAIIYNHNGKCFFEKCFASLAAQILPPQEIILVDGDSTDGSQEFIRDRYPHFTLIENNQDIGFAAAMNQGIQKARSPLILLINLDTLMTSPYLELLVKVIQQDAKIGSVSGKLYLLNSDDKNPKLDTTGHIMQATRVPFNRGASEFDWGQYDTLDQDAIFGVSGTLPLYRKAMLEDIADQGEYFDELFHAYYEDVDVDWRARLRGWESLYVPNAVAYHARGGLGYNTKRDNQIHNFKNRYLMIFKNDHWQNLWRDTLFLIQYEINTLFEILPTKPYLLKAHWLLLKSFPEILRKRRFIQSRRKIAPKEMQKWFLVKEEQIQTMANTITTLFFVIVLIKWLGFLNILFLALIGYGLIGGGTTWLLSKLRPPIKQHQPNEQKS